jgi:hypothetical protein
MRLTLIATAAVAALALAACGQTTAEKVGEDTGAAIDNAAGEAAQATENAVENTGEALDKAGDSVEGAVNRATDDNPATQP